MNLVVMDSFAGNSNTAVPTEQAVKTYGYPLQSNVLMAQGDILYRDGLQRLGIGTAGHVLLTAGNGVEWGDPPEVEE